MLLWFGFPDQRYVSGSRLNKVALLWCDTFDQFFLVQYRLTKILASNLWCVVTNDKRHAHHNDSRYKEVIIKLYVTHHAKRDLNGTPR